MSAKGHKQIYAPQKAMSALPPKADVCGALACVCFGPKADIGQRYSITSSARLSSECGTVRPSTLAVLRLISGARHARAGLVKSPPLPMCKIRGTTGVPIQ
jgi:hypothetical protein